MRIPDIIAEHIAPGSVVVDLTPERAGLSSYLELPPSFGARYQREVAGSDAERAIVARVVPSSLDDGPWSFGEPSGRRADLIHLLFFERVEDVTSASVLEAAAQAGLELYAAHFTQLKPYRLAATFGPPTPEAGGERARLRALNEARFQRLVLRIREEELERTEARAQRAERLERKLESSTAKLGDLGAELERLRAEHAQARAALGELRARTQGLEARLARTRTRLDSARRSMSFRVGRAATVALRAARTNPLAAPARFLATLRGKDDVLEELDREPVRQRGRRSSPPSGDAG